MSPDLGQIKTPDERILIDKFRQAKSMVHAGIEIVLRDGLMVRMNVTEKIDLDKAGPSRKLRE